MAIYNINADVLQNAYNYNGVEVNKAFDINGTEIYPGYNDYSQYSYTQKWGNKGVLYAQGLDIKDGKVFWVSEPGNPTTPSDCYVWNLSDGSQALSTPYITVYSGHGNNLSFASDKNELIATSAYSPSRVFINTFSVDYTMTLDKTLKLLDGSNDCDACYDPDDSSIMYSIGHTSTSSDREAPFYISKWDISSLTDNGDGTYSPLRLSRISIPQPSNSFYYQGCKFHDGLFWFASGYGDGNTSTYVYGVDPENGRTIAVINCQTMQEPEGIAWVRDNDASGEYALYVGFVGMLLRKYTF